MQATHIDHTTALNGLFRVQQNAHSDDPSLADPRLGALLYIAIRTATYEPTGLPNVKDVAEALGLSRGGASRVLANLSPHGRGNAEQRVRAKVQGGAGLGLVTSNPDPRDRRAEAFTLTRKGQERVAALLSALTGHAIACISSLSFEAWLDRFLSDRKEQRP